MKLPEKGLLGKENFRILFEIEAGGFCLLNFPFKVAPNTNSI